MKISGLLEKTKLTKRDIPGLAVILPVLWFIDLCAIYYVELNVISVSHKTLLPLAAVDVLCFFAMLCYLIRIRKRQSRRSTILFLVLLPVADLVLIEGMLGHLDTISFSYWIANIIVYYALMGFFFLFFRSTRLVLICYHGVLVIAAAVDYFVFKLRGRPFMVQDIRSATTAAQVVGVYTYDIEPGSAIYLTIMVSFFFVIAYLPVIFNKKFHILRKSLVIVMGAILGLFLTNGSMMERLSIMDFNQWDIEGNYQSKGYLLALLAEMKYCRNEKPEGYSVETINEIRDKYMGTAKQEEGIAHREFPVNLIVIMNESWSDLRYIGSFEEDDTITPYIDSLSENVIKGFVHVPVFGNGTANTEYEVLTGNTMHFLGLANTAYLLYTSDSEYGMVTTLQTQDFRSIALHPFEATNWSRHIVYPQMKFDAFYSEPDWPEEYQKQLRWCMSDEGSYDMLIKQYEDKEDPQERLFTFLVTMQNHGGYAWNEFDSTMTWSYAGEYPLAEQYLTLIKETDNAFRYLVEYFETVETPTMVIMFGDHLPNIEESFYEMLLGCGWNERTALDNQKLYTTPFVIWTNYEIEEQSDIELSTNYFGSYILDLAGLKMSDYQRCLLAFSEKMPVIGMGMVMDGDGNWYADTEMPEQLQQIYRDYQILQYNNVFGGKNRQMDLFMVGD